jgi:hypothetical protein
MLLKSSEHLHLVLFCEHTATMPLREEKAARVVKIPSVTSHAPPKSASATHRAQASSHGAKRVNGHSNAPQRSAKPAPANSAGPAYDAQVSIIVYEHLA